MYGRLLLPSRTVCCLNISHHILTLPLRYWCRQTRSGKPDSLYWFYWFSLCQQHDRLRLRTLQESLGEKRLIGAVIMPSKCVTSTPVNQGPDCDTSRPLPCVQLYWHVCTWSSTASEHNMRDIHPLLHWYATSCATSAYKETEKRTDALSGVVPVLQCWSQSNLFTHSPSTLARHLWLTLSCSLCLSNYLQASVIRWDDTHTHKTCARVCTHFTPPQTQGALQIPLTQSKYKVQPGATVLVVWDEESAKRKYQWIISKKKDRTGGLPSTPEAKYCK